MSNTWEIINNLIGDEKLNADRIRKMRHERYVKRVTSFLKRQRMGTIDTTPVYYDLYNFLGTTYATGTTSPVPSSAYIASLISGDIYGYSFKYPVYGFVVPHGETPESITDGATPWEFQTTIAVIKTIVQIPNMTEIMLDGAKIISYLYKEDGSAVGDLKFIYLEEGQNVDEQSIDFSSYHRWVKLSNIDEEHTGYNLEYYAIYPVPENQQIHLTTNLYITNSKKDNYAQKIKL